MRYLKNPIFKAYRTACGHVMVRTTDKQPISKLNTTAAMIFNGLDQPIRLTALVSEIAQKNQIAEEHIAADVEECLQGLVTLNYVQVVD